MSRMYNCVIKEPDALSEDNEGSLWSSIILGDDRLEPYSMVYLVQEKSKTIPRGN